MKVKELIKQLSHMDQDAIVVVRGYEAGVDEVGACTSCEIALNVNEEWYYGDHEVFTERDKATDPTQKLVAAVYLIK